MKRAFRVLLVMLVCFVGVISLTGCGKDNQTGKTVLLNLNTQGLGQLSYYVDENNKLDFNDEYPHQSAKLI